MKNPNKIVIYKAAPGATYNDKQASIIGKCLEKIGAGKYKDIQPEEVVNYARDKRSPLHEFFTWDNTTAANAYRIFQARNLVNHLRIVILTKTGTINTKAFHNIVVPQLEEDESARFYRPTMSMRGISEENIRQQVIEGAKRELESWRQRYREYEDVFGRVFAEIDKALQ